MGYNARTNSDSVVAIGAGAQSFGSGSVVIGASAYAGSTNSVGIGNTANANGANSIAIGNGVTASANTVRIGGSGTTSIGGPAIWTNTSDRRLKTDIKDTDLGLDFIASLRPVSYRMIEGDGRISYGFIAQEVEDTLKRRGLSAAGATSGDGPKAAMVQVEDDEMATRMMGYTEIIAPLVKSVQELKQSNDNLKMGLGVLGAGRAGVAGYAFLALRRRRSR